jgi:hypothetical protein
MDLAQEFKFEPNPIYKMGGQCGVLLGWLASLSAIWASFLTYV